MNEIFQFTDERASEGDTFRCRKCRVYLFSFDNLSNFHKKIEPVDQCSAWYIDSDEIDGGEEDTLVWIREAVYKSQWTEGKLYCPKCTSRIGSFNFTQGVRCSCFTFIIPAIWIQKCKVDQTSTSDSKPNIRLPDNPDNNGDGGNTKCGSPMYYMETTQTGCQSSQTCSDSSQSGSKTSESGSQTKMESGQNESMVDNEMICSCRPYEYMYDHEVPSETLNQENKTVPRQRRVMKCTINCGQNTQDFDNHFYQKISDKRTRNFSSIQGNPSEISNTVFNHEAESHNKIHKRKIHRQMELDAEMLHFQRRETFSTNEHMKDLPSSRLDTLTKREDGSRFEVLEEMEHESEEVVKTADQSEEHQSHQVEEIPDQVTCPVCLDLLYDPLVCPCSHVFCDSCLRILNSKSRHIVPRCPLCRKSVYYVYPAIEIREEIKKCYPKAYKERHKAERRAPHRRLPLPNGRMKPRQKKSNRYPDVGMPYSVLVVLGCVLACCGLCLLILFVFCPPTCNRCITVIGYEWMNG